MEIIIFENSNCTEPFWKYTPKTVTRHSSIEDLNGCFVSNLSQIDCMKNSHEKLVILPYNFLTIPIWELVTKLDTQSCDRLKNNCYKYLCTVIDQILEHLTCFKYDAGRTLSSILSDKFDSELSFQETYTKIKFPIYQKDYLSKIDLLRDKVIGNLAFTNIETSVILNALYFPNSDYRELSLVETPKLKLGSTINPFYMQENEYIATVDFTSELPEIWMFYLSLHKVRDVIIHSSIIKLLIANNLGDCFIIKSLSIAESKLGFPKQLKFLETVNIAEWLKVELSNKVVLHSIYQSSCNFVFSITSQIRALTVLKAIELSKSGICVTCLGPLELSVIFSNGDKASVLERCREILLYVE